MGAEPSSFAEWLAEHPPADDRFRQSLAFVAERTVAGEPFLVAIREFLDEFALLPREDLRARAISEPPALLADSRYDAYLGALAEHLALTHDLSRPAWSIDPTRFLSTWWFVSQVEGFRALALVHSPAAFRRRGVFLGPGALDRC